MTLKCTTPTTMKSVRTRAPAISPSSDPPARGLLHSPRCFRRACSLWNRKNAFEHKLHETVVPVNCSTPHSFWPLQVIRCGFDCTQEHCGAVANPLSNRRSWWEVQFRVRVGARMFLLQFRPARKPAGIDFPPPTIERGFSPFLPSWGSNTLLLGTHSRENQVQHLCFPVHRFAPAFIVVGMQGPTGPRAVCLSIGFESGTPGTFCLQPTIRGGGWTTKNNVYPRKKDPFNPWLRVRWVALVP